MRQWRVDGKLFVWERPLRPKEIQALGDEAPSGPILGARVEHFVAKEALLADDPSVFFTTPHFDRTPAAPVRLDRIAAKDLEEVVTEAWLARAAKRLREAYPKGLAASPRQAQANASAGSTKRSGVLGAVPPLSPRREPCRPCLEGAAIIASGIPAWSVIHAMIAAESAPAARIAARSITAPPER